MITKEMSIGEIVQKFPQTVAVFQANGMGCLGCAVARFENLAEGAAAHGIDVEKILKELNEAIQ